MSHQVVSCFTGKTALHAVLFFPVKNEGGCDRGSLTEPAGVNIA